jgi:hypothetical protein
LARDRRAIPTGQSFERHRFAGRRYKAADQSPGCRRYRCRFDWEFDGKLDDRLGGCTFEEAYTFEKGYTLERGYRLEEGCRLEEPGNHIVHSPPPPRRSEPKCPQLRL